MDRETKKNFKKRLRKGLIQAAVMFGALLLFSLLQSTASGQAAFLRSAGFSILAVFGYTLNRFFNDIGTKGTLARYYYAGTAAGMVLGSLGLWLALAAFNPFRLWPGRFSLIFFCGIIGLALSRLAAYGEDRRGSIWWEFARWMKGLPPLKFGFGIAIGFYLVYFRPYLTIDPVSLMLAEWMIFCILTAVILIRIWISLTHTHLNEETGLKWNKHRLQVERLTAPVHDYMTRVERQFITGGDPLGLFVLLTTMMDDNRIEERKIRTILQPLIDFKGINEFRSSGFTMTIHTKQYQIDKRTAALEQVYSSAGYATGIRHRSIFETEEPTESVSPVQTDDSLQTMEWQFIKEGVRTGLFVRLALLLHRAGRRQEHIIWTLRGLTDDNGKPSSFALKKLLTQLYEPATAGNDNER